MTKSQEKSNLSDSHPGSRSLREDSIRLGVKDHDNLPFYICPEGAETATLLVHGFTATPWEMRPLAEFLAEANIASLAVRLPGHGTSPEDLANCTWEDWSKSIEEGHQVLQQDFQTIYGMGMSTGCLLLLNLATALKFKGLVLFSPYLQILHKLAPYAGLLRWFKPYHVKSTDSHLENRYYNRRPLVGIHQINRLIKVVKTQLPEIACPIMAFNGEADETIAIDSSRDLMQSLGSKVKIHEIYGPDVPHVLTREENPCRWSMFAQASHFVQEIENPGKPSVVR
ncbi:MAG: alpha/beta fold hydrolase [Gammaproteobacteria bacterium]|nr:alpha/beta fold hydrolase [Gammaproteobacteria bacterium]NIR94185.1 alpha/beta fold hydrolase [Gammaproteobacteria bacterium]